MEGRSACLLAVCGGRGWCFVRSSSTASALCWGFCLARFRMTASLWSNRFSLLRKVLAFSSTSLEGSGGVGGVDKGEKGTLREAATKSYNNGSTQPLSTWILVCMYCINKDR